MRIYNPTYGVVPDAQDAPAEVSRTAPAGSIGLYSNSKPNASELLRQIAKNVERELGTPEAGFVSKPNAAVAGDAETYDWLAERYRFVLLASGD